ncbi:tumor necrosis factor ligand superfamily member 4 isoform X2 [Moschus berezovskii]|uniref:tumor necrosis factor ligand superfamily member 4 isoform X2 n=1 Tax=Moschus berezovskii TaxID=68408 RepID=UPI002443DF6C|nr:tumor necrosis factor ligand superfamily member 4 isoform X2 [Moschus berezovskii]
MEGQLNAGFQDTGIHGELIFGRELAFSGPGTEMEAKMEEVPSQYPPIQSIRVRFTKCENENGFIITSPDTDGTMKVQNNSIIITCDGFYLISLKGYFSQQLSLRLLYRKGREPLFSLNMVKFVDSVTVAYLRFKDKVYLNVTTQNASCEDIQVNGGELILIHQNPGGFCVY